MSKAKEIDLNFLKKSNLKWLEQNLLFLTIHGSWAYGTNTEKSDIDLRGIAVPPKEYYFGILNTFEQVQFKEPYDAVVFDLRKFVKLAMDGNPNCLELIFTDPEFHIVNKSLFSPLFDIRESFLSKKCKHTFSGYARSQLRRINLHRRYLQNPPKGKPERADFGLPDNHKLIPEHQMLEIEAQIQKRLEEWQFDSTGLDNDVAIQVKNDFYDILRDLKVNHNDMHLYAARSLGLDDNLTEAFKKERQYKSALTEWKQYNVWLKERNKERFELEQKFGFDAKHAMHLARLYLSCTEVLRDHKLQVKRPDAEFLLSIRNGAFTYEELIEWADKQDTILEELYKTSTLPKEPNRKLINEKLIEVIEKVLNE